MSTESLQATPKQNAIAVVLLGIILLSLWGRFEFEDAAFKTTALTVLDNNDSHLITHVGNMIVVINESGSINRVFSYEELGLNGTITDIQLLNNNDFLVGIEESKNIYRCAISKKACYAENIPIMQSVSNIFRFRYVSSLNAYYISDTGNHRIIYVDLNKNDAAVISKSGQFKYPNEIIYTAKDKIFIVDNNHFKVAAYDHSSGKLEESSLVYTTKTKLSENSFPVDIGLSQSGEMFATISNYTLTSSDIVAYSEDGKAVKKLAVKKDGHPHSITSINNQLIIAFPEQYQLSAYDYSYETLTNFSNLKLLNLLQSVKKEKEHFQLLSLLMLVLAVIAGSGMIWIAITISNNNKARDERKNVEVLPEASFQKYDGIHWIEPDFTILRNMKFVMISVSILLAIIMLFLWYGIGPLDLKIDEALPDGIFQTLLGMSALFIFVILFVVFNSIPKLNNRIGTDGVKLYVEKYKKQQHSFLPEELLFSHNIIYTDKERIMLQLGNGKSLYSESEIKTHILPLLEKAKKISSINLFIRRLSELRFDAISGLIAIVALVYFLANPSVWLGF